MTTTAGNSPKKCNGQKFGAQEKCVHQSVYIILHIVSTWNSSDTMDFAYFQLAFIPPPNLCWPQRPAKAGTKSLCNLEI
eukprot:c11941_g1_i1 orf=397-633(-)